MQYFILKHIHKHKLMQTCTLTLFHIHIIVYIRIQQPADLYVEDVDFVQLVCEVYGYPHITSHPVWRRRGNSVQNDNKYSVSGCLFSGMSVSYDQRVVSALSILNVTVEDTGEYTCSVSGNSSTVALTVLPGKLKIYLIYI